jgi:hypothetical protein
MIRRSHKLGPRDDLFVDGGVMAGA